MSFIFTKGQHQGFTLVKWKCLTTLELYIIYSYCTILKDASHQTKQKLCQTRKNYTFTTFPVSTDKYSVLAWKCFHQIKNKSVCSDRRQAKFRLHVILKSIYLYIEKFHNLDL